MEGEERFTFSFFLRHVADGLRIERQFNLQRPLSEPSAAFLHRLNANVDKVVAKKRKKRKQQVSPVKLNPMTVLHPVWFITDTV